MGIEIILRIASVAILVFIGWGYLKSRNMKIERDKNKQ